MDKKTQVSAENGRQDLWITRQFDLPAELVFKAYTEAEFFEQWMGTKLLKFDCKPHGSYRFETCDPKGNVAFYANGVFHRIVQNLEVTRTFEMEGSPFGVQLEFLDFEPIDEVTSKLKIHIIFQSGDQRDQMLRLPFSQGINMAHNRLQELFNTEK